MVDLNQMYQSYIISKSYTTIIKGRLYKNIFLKYDELLSIYKKLTSNILISKTESQQIDKDISFKNKIK